MKRFSISILFALSLASESHAGPTVFVNPGLITSPTNIVANIFINQGTIDFLATITNVTVSSDPFSAQLFQTHQTLDWTNTTSGVMIGQPGFGFYDQSSKGLVPSTSFDNAGLIQDFDIPVEALSFLGIQLEPVQVMPPAINAPVPGSTVVSATNINVSGQMIVGDNGRVQMTGQNVQLNGSTLIAGTVGDNMLDPEATMDRGIQGALIQGAVVYPAFSPAVDVYDLFWGATNGASFNGDVENLSETYLGPTEVEVEAEFPYIMGSRNGSVEGVPLYDGVLSEYVVPLNGNTISLNGITFPSANFVPYVLQYTISTDPTTNYVDIILVNTEFANTNITAEVGIFPGVGNNVLTNQDANAYECMVKFSSTMFDVVSGQNMTNSIYLIDSGAVQTPVWGSTNCTYLNDAKPTTFEITRNEPIEWEDWLLVQASYPFEVGLDPVTIEDLIYTAGETKNATAPMTNAAYAAQIGRNPEDPSGLFPFTQTLIGTSKFDMPDLTNEPARIEINAKKLDVTGMTLRANGVTRLYATNFTGTPAAMDFGNFTTDLGNIKSALTVTNVFPVNYQRLLGDVVAWNSTWLNIQTNDGTTNKITNYFHFHMLVVDQDLRSSFKPSALSLALRGSTVEVDDPLNVIGGALFQATNLTLNSSLHMTGNTPQLLTSNMPTVKNLLIGPNGSITADQDIILDVATTAGHITPATATFNIKSITNLNTITSGTIELQSQLFANGGTVLAGNNGLITINSKTNLLNAGLGYTNLLQAGSDINLYSVVIQATNSTILAGQSGVGQLTLYASGQLTDFYPSTSSTNSYMTNFWQTTFGFSLPVKPLSGDLFGTQIKTIAAGAHQVVRHYWAGQDLGASPAGFFNNAVIGHLILDRTSAGATLRFSGTGAKNAMYVDFLDLEDLSFSDYQNGLVIDPNLTIYFASANFPPSKLTAGHKNLIWVPQFAGPNSTSVVQHKDGSTCLMNASLATSPDIDSDFDGIPNSKDPFPLDNSNPYVGAIACPSSVNSAQLLNITNGGVPQILGLYATGQGTITPSIKTANVGQTLVLTAVPAAGWSFLSWSGGVTASTPTISFVIPATNAILTANFIVNPLPSLSGTYNGLFYQTAGLTASSSGAVTFTVTSAGAASGKLTIGPAAFPFTAQFFGSGLASVHATNGTNILTVTLQLDTTKLSDQATGDVASGAWDAALIADRAPVRTAKNPSPQAGNYTFILPGDANPAASPGGDSYGTITVSSLGALSAVGTLADGVGFSQSVPVSAEGQWPLYFSATGGQTLIGWVNFIANELTGKVNWIKLPGSGPFYTNGFNTNAVLLGDKYVAPTGQTTGLGYSNATVNLSGGNLAAAVASSVSLSGGVTFQTANKTTLTLTVTPKTGAFTGQYTPGAGSPKIPLSGVVLPNEQVARGLFLGTNQSGEVLLQKQ